MEKIAKIGPVDPAIIVLRAITKNKEINASKKYIARSASLPIGLNYLGSSTIKYCSEPSLVLVLGAS